MPCLAKISTLHVTTPISGAAGDPRTTNPCCAHGRRRYDAAPTRRNNNRMYSQLPHPKAGIRNIQRGTGQGLPKNAHPSQSTGKSGLYTLELHHNDAPAMLEILKALHYRSHQVSKRISFPDLVVIAQRSEKYGLYEALHPWAQLWMPQVAHLACEPGCEHWLLIAWAFREKRVFRELSRTVILELAPGSSLLHPSLPGSVVGMYTQVAASRNVRSSANQYR